MKYFNLFCLAIVVFIVTGCSKKEVKLPLINTPGISEIYNHSSIWIFYQKSKTDTIADLNKNNKIINTHWIFHIDKRLKMKSVIPHLISLQKDNNKDSMHKKEGMLNYFSYADGKSQKISLIRFYQTDFVISGKPNQDHHNHKGIKLQIINGKLKFDSGYIDLANMSSEALDKFQQQLKDQPLVCLHYPEDTRFQNYLNAKVFLESNEVVSAKAEYVYNVK